MSPSTWNILIFFAIYLSGSSSSPLKESANLRDAQHVARNNLKRSQGDLPINEDDIYADSKPKDAKELLNVYKEKPDSKELLHVYKETEKDFEESFKDKAGAVDEKAGLVTSPVSHETTTPDKHGGVKMGEVTHGCDDLQWNLELDWDNTTDYEYTCKAALGEDKYPITDSDPIQSCIPKKEIPSPFHRCMDTKIVYEDPPPTAGPHRPNWPSFGTYLYVPPQRWVHSLEHGSVVLLYHPCASPEQVRILSNIVRSCIRKHIITPYRELSIERPLALITYGCKYIMGRVDQAKAIKFIKETAMDTEESFVTRDGLYTWGQQKKANIVSDLKDSELCPNPPIYISDLPIAENMDKPYLPNKENILVVSEDQPKE